MEASATFDSKSQRAVKLADILADWTDGRVSLEACHAVANSRVGEHSIERAESQERTSEILSRASKVLMAVAGTGIVASGAVVAHGMIDPGFLPSDPIGLNQVMTGMFTASAGAGVLKLSDVAHNMAERFRIRSQETRNWLQDKVDSFDRRKLSVDNEAKLLEGVLRTGESHFDYPVVDAPVDGFYVSQFPDGDGEVINDVGETVFRQSKTAGGYVTEAGKSSGFCPEDLLREDSENLTL